MAEQIISNDQGEAVALRHALAESLKQQRALRTAQVEAAFRDVPRHLFVPGVALDHAYSDGAVATKRADGHVISASSQPGMMAIMLEQLDLQPGHRVLEIGAGTGYNAALMAHIVGDSGHVTTVDIDEDIVRNARQHLAAAGFERVVAVCRDGGMGYLEHAPYDRIILTVAAWDIAPAWRDQLKPGGKLVLPLSLCGPQRSIAFVNANDHLESVSIADCGFMRLRGAFSGPETTVHLGPEPGLQLELYESRQIDTDAIYAWLQGPSDDHATSILVNRLELYGPISLWLALHEPGLCNLTAEGALVERGIVPSVFTWSGAWNQCATFGLLSHDGLCVVTPLPDGEAVPGGSSWHTPFAFIVRSFGADRDLTQRLINAVADWNTAGRPSNAQLRISAYPQNVAYQQTANEVIIPKRWNQLVLNWA